MDMKKFGIAVIVMLGIGLGIGFTGCAMKNRMDENKNSQQSSEETTENTNKNSQQPSEEATENTNENSHSQRVFLASVIEIEKQSILVKPHEGEWELYSADQIRIGKNAFASAEEMSELEIGDVVQIEYDGTILETYPAQLSNVSAVYKVNGQDKEDFQQIEMFQQTDMVTAEYHYQYANMLLQLPNDWEYEILSADQKEENLRTFGIRFWPAEESDFKLELLYWMDKIGICATGVTIEKVAFENEMTAARYTETINGVRYVTWIYEDLPGTYAVSGNASEAVWEKYDRTIKEILESAELGKGNRTEEEAIAIASKAYLERISMPKSVYEEVKQTEDFAGFFDRERVRATFQCEDGRWKIEFSPSNGEEKPQVIWVDADGEVLDTEY